MRLAEPLESMTTSNNKTSKKKKKHFSTLCNPGKDILRWDMYILNNSKHDEDSLCPLGTYGANIYTKKQLKQLKKNTKSRESDKHKIDYLEGNVF